MKTASCLVLSLLVVVLFFFSCHAKANVNVGNPPIVAYVDSISTWWGCDVPQGLGLPAPGQQYGYNTVLLSFWISSGTPADAVALWANPTQYIPPNCNLGTNTSDIQRNLLSQFHDAGITLMVSAFGSTDYPTSEDPTTVCTNLAQFVLDNNLDGVDLDYEDSGAFNANGDGESWLITCTQILRSKLPAPQYIITHAPQGPYFTTAALYPQGAYLKIDSTVGSLIDWYNLQYYNQGSDVYVTYQDLMVSCTEFPGTAVMELNLKTTYGIALGKPATPTDASNGYVDPSDLVSWIQEANKQSGVCVGGMYWELGSDTNGVFGNTLKAGLPQCESVQKKMMKLIQ